MSEATLAAERAILSLVGVPVVARDVPVGPTERHTMRTYEVGATATPPTPANVDADDMAPRMKALRVVGVPYTDAEIAQAAQDVKGRTEMDALIAYLQVLGTARK